jgi:hypothetical protein
MFFFNRAIAIADRDKDVGTPFMALENKAEEVQGRHEEAIRA